MVKAASAAECNTKQTLAVPNCKRAVTHTARDAKPHVTLDRELEFRAAWLERVHPSMPSGRLFVVLAAKAIRSQRPERLTAAVTHMCPLAEPLLTLRAHAHTSSQARHSTLSAQDSVGESGTKCSYFAPGATLPQPALS